MQTGKPIAGQLGVVTANVVPLRAEPDGDTEQVTQALIGQPVIAEGGQGEWLFVQTWDTYRGWIRAQAVRALEDGSRPYASTGPVAVIRELIVDVLAEPHERAPIITKVTISAEIEVSTYNDDWVELALPGQGKGFIHRHEARLLDRDAAHTIPLPDPRRLAETALRFVGVPYLWGGTSPFGIDCSGFVQLIYRVHGVTLLRDAHIQAGDARGEAVAREKLRTGDLIFFGKTAEPDTSGITHVGMALDRERFVHSGGNCGVAVATFAESEDTPKDRGARRLRLATLDLGGGAPED